ncbi:MAG: ABC transporter substrate-binding protein [Acidiferrobacterales bacterium]|nr:ABC transporter substrate-binding protein [Acidiferrobacterales bacterium]
MKVNSFSARCFVEKASLLVICFSFLCIANPAISLAETVYEIGYLDYKKDPRYKKKALYAKYLGKPLGRSNQGAKTALKEIKFHGKALGITFELNQKRFRKPAELAELMQEFADEKVDFVLVDLEADLLLEAANLAENHGITILNVSAADTRLRQQDCRKNVFHVIPSHNMLMDALSQHLASLKWRSVLALVGPSPGDKAVLETFRASAKRYGIKISKEREFVLGSDPRVREKNNTKLLTQGDYDVIFVADTDGEFARHLPYKTVKPTPVVGAEGLAPVAWHWAWDRYGAPQLEKRFEKQSKRPMGSNDWAAWLAVKMIAKGIQTTEKTERDVLVNFFTDPETVFDGFKGNRVNFRSWNHQLRQPILLVTHNWVIQRTPIEGFLHKTQNLDTLGIDAPESQCELN